MKNARTRPRTKVLTFSLRRGMRAGGMDGSAVSLRYCTRCIRHWLYRGMRPLRQRDASWLFAHCAAPWRRVFCRGGWPLRCEVRWLRAVSVSLRWNIQGRGARPRRTPPNPQTAHRIFRIQIHKEASFNSCSRDVILHPRVKSRMDLPPSAKGGGTIHAEGKVRY